MPLKTPANVSGWKAYAASSSLSKLPLKDVHFEDADKYVQRDIVADVRKIFSSSSTFRYLVADVITIETADQTILLPEGGFIALYARVLSADLPISLAVKTNCDVDSTLFLYASVLDQSISITYDGKIVGPLSLGINSEYQGVQISFSKGVPTIQYVVDYDNLASMPSIFEESLRSQLRIANIMFWNAPDIAASIAAYVVRVTENSTTGTLLNVQAASISQQLAATEIAGSNTIYAPVLNLGTYKSNLLEAINTAAAFEAQFDRFVDRKAILDDTRSAYDAMLGHSRDAVAMQRRLSDDALAKWNSACGILDATVMSFRVHQTNLTDAESKFRVGVEQWKREQILKVVAGTLLAVATIAVAIGLLCVGDPEATAGAAGQVAATTQQVVKLTKENLHGLLRPETLKALKDVLEILDKVYESTSKLVEQAKTLEGTSFDTITATSVGNDADLNQIVGLKAWDDWMLDSDATLAFAVEQKIDGASEYRLELQKHALDGKLVCQARAQSVKAGQAYVQVKMVLSIALADVARLQALQKTYSNESAQLAEAQAMFYDRLMAIRTSVLIEMRNVTWASRYLTLRQSGVVLDPLRSILELREDCTLVSQELEGWKSSYSSDPSPFTEVLETSRKFPSITAADVVASLKKEGMATFTLVPGAGPAFSGPFIKGSRFRLRGMRVYLQGALAKSLDRDDDTLISMTISTSGIYSDIRDGQVSTFTMLRLSRPFRYNVAKDGKVGDIVVDSVTPNEDHVPPTPFTQWTIRINDYDELDLTGLKGLRLEWLGSAYFDDDTRLETAL